MATLHDNEPISRSDEARFQQAERCARHLERGRTVQICGVIRAQLNMPLYQEFGLHQLMVRRSGSKLKKWAVSAAQLRLYLQTSGPVRVLG